MKKEFFFISDEIVICHNDEYIDELFDNCNNDVHISNAYSSIAKIENGIDN